MTNLIQASFAKGELSPALFGRVDTAAYQVGLARAYNLVIHSYGGASNRPGTVFVAPQKDHDYAARLVPFAFNTTDAYMLEFGHLYMRVMRGGAHVLEAAKTITGVTQANPGVVTATSHGFSNGDDVFIQGVVGMTRLNLRWFRVAGQTTHTFQLTDPVTGANVSTAAFAAYVSGGTVARVYTIATPYDSDDLLQLDYVQSADVMTITHRSYAPRELGRTGHASWTLSTISFEPTQGFALYSSVTPNTTGARVVKYQVTAVNEAGVESLPYINATTKTITGITQSNPAVVSSTSHGLVTGEEVYLTGIAGMTELNGRRFTVGDVNTNDFQLLGENTINYTAYSSGGTAQVTSIGITNAHATIDNTVVWAVVSGAKYYRIYRNDTGVFGLVGESGGNTFEDDNATVDTGVTPPQQRNPFFLSTKYPATVSYYEQRRVFGGSNAAPDTSEYSRIGDFDNFSRSNPIQPDDAITATLAARQVNQIRHYVPGNDLLILTNGSEWKANSGSDSAFEAATLKQKPQSEWGSGFQRPIVSGTTTLFVQANNSAIRSLGYSLQLDGYTGNDLSILAKHMLTGYQKQIVDWDYQRSPDSVIIMTRADGIALAMTFNQEQEVVAWSRWETDGKYERVGVLRATDDETEDTAYFVVKRVINGSVVRYIERTHSRVFDDVRDCFFVDCGLSFDNPLTITDITLADPIVVECPSHGLSNGDKVDLSDIIWAPNVDARTQKKTQPDQLNGRRFKVANVATDTFELQTEAGVDVDGSAYNAYLEGGFAREPATTISGLDHIEGEAVVVLADGNVVSNLTVTNGAITLTRAASRVHVGLRYIADLETLNIEAPQGTIQGKKKRIPKVTVRFEKSRGLLVGPNENRLTEMKQRENENMGEPTALLTGDKKITLKPNWNTNGRMLLRQVYPLPMTILAVIPDVLVGD